MRITKFGHAAVRIEEGAGALVIDPGGFSEPECVDGVGAILITHEHPDHLDPSNLRRSDAPIFAGHGVAEALRDTDPEIAERVTVVAAGDTFQAAGLTVAAVGEWHHEIHPDIPLIQNTAYLVADSVFHPGDSYTPPPHPVPTLLMPVCAPWLRLADAVDFARGAGSATVLGIHDGLLNENGHQIYGGVASRLLDRAGLTFRQLSPGTDL